MSGWVPFPADAWPEVAAALPVPWPEGAAIFDLRWHVDRTPGRIVPHGKRYWMKRWGWTDWGVRSLLRSDSWHDPIHPLPAQDPPADHPPTTRQPPAPQRTKADRQGDSARRPPANHPPATQDPPNRLHRRVDPPSPSPSPSQEQQRPLSAPAPGVPAWARVKGSDPYDVLAAVTRALSAVRGRLVDPDRCATDAKHVIGLQRATGQPWSELADDLVAVAEWARDSDEAANDIRGVRPDGSVWGQDRSRSVATLCVQARWADRVEAARAWAAPPPTAQPEPDEDPYEPSMVAGWRTRRPLRALELVGDDDDSIGAAIRRMGVNRG